MFNREAHEMQYAPPQVVKLSKQREVEAVDVFGASPPHNFEAEQGVLGAILLRNDALERVVDILEPAHFFDPLHRQIYELASKLISAQRLASPITLKPFFEKAEPINETTTVPQYLGTLAVNATTINNVADYARIIRDMAIRRDLVMIGQDLVTGATEAHVDFPPEEQVEEAEARLFALVERSERGKEADLSEAIAEAMAEVEEAHKGEKTGLSTGISDLDEIIGRLQPTDLLILAGRPGMGKSALAANIAHFVAREKHDKDGVVIAGTPVAFYSLEMSKAQVALRLMGESSEMASSKMRKGELDSAQLGKLRDHIKGMTRIPVTVDDTGALSIAQLTARARRLKRRKNIGLIVVDYLQLMKSTKNTGNRVQDVAEITTGLKALAKELRVPIIALSQLSRGVESRDNKRPQLADLRESGSIEQDADIVMFVYRDEYYLEREKPSLTEPSAYADWNDKLMKVAGTAEIIVAKQRHGSTGTVKAHFNSELMRFSNLAKEVAR
jgi:replicative DNA helicase